MTTLELLQTDPVRLEPDHLMARAAKKAEESRHRDNHVTKRKHARRHDDHTTAAIDKASEVRHRDKGKTHCTHATATAGTDNRRKKTRLSRKEYKLRANWRDRCNRARQAALRTDLIDLDLSPHAVAMLT